AIVVTLDARVRHRFNQTLQPTMLHHSRDCGACHVSTSRDPCLRAPLFSGLDVTRVTALEPPDQSLAWFDRLRGRVKGKLFAKGVVTADDARLALQHGADAVIVSNHGGRNEETLRPTIDCVPEVVAAVQ